MRFLVIGGGISGLFLSYYLLDAGQDVALIDATRGEVRTSAYNAGQLSCRPSFTDIFKGGDDVRVSKAERRRNREWFGLSRAQSRDRYEEVAAALSARSLALYQRFFSREKGGLDLARKVLDLRSSIGTETPASGHEGRFMDARELAELGYKGFEGGWLVDELSLHSGKLLEHLRSRISALGGDTRQGEVRLKKRGPRISRALVDGEEVVADAYVVAAGSWSSEVCRPLRYDPFVVPARGLVLFYLTNGKQVIDCPAHYEDEGVTVTQHDRDTLRLTGFFELVGFNPRFSESRKEWLFEAVTSHFSRSCRLELNVTGVGYRPCAPDQLPVVGRVPGCDNGYILTGSCRKGMALAPALSQLVMGCALGAYDTKDPLVRALDPGRFERDAMRPRWEPERAPNKTRLPKF